MKLGCPLFTSQGKLLSSLVAVTSILLPQQRGVKRILSCLVYQLVATPLMIYPRLRSVPDNLRTGAVPSTMFCNSENGWINSTIYFEWFKFFVSSIPPIRPVLL